MWPALSACQCASGPSPRQDTMPMPVIHASRVLSPMGERLARELEECRHFLHAGAKVRIGTFHEPEGHLGVAGKLVLAANIRLGDGEARTLVHELGRERQCLPGCHERTQLDV